MQTHQAKAANFLAIGFAMVVLTISATTSFGFFYSFFSGIIPTAVLPQSIGALISGSIGVMLFDAATVTWLILFLHHSQTPEQRAITLIMTVLTFIGSAAASIAYITLTADGQLAVDVATADTVSNMALAVVILGIVANFGAMQMYNRYSYDNKQKVLQSNRRDMLQTAEDSQARYLDDLIAQQVTEQLTRIAPNLAQQQAAKLVAQFYRNETAKYANGDSKQTLPPPTTQPRRQQLEDLHHRLGNGNGNGNGNGANFTNGQEGI